MMSKLKKLKLECSLFIGHVASETNRWTVAKSAFEKGYQVAKELELGEVAQQCLCNMGITMGNMAIESKKPVINELQGQEEEDESFLDI
jgi:hypothetical protein